ncbi:hypothetical protein CJ178_04610 [Rhodococcus sp. ACPA4]|nr:hypothetical protein CJ178_04610 [Rhodococcus sp. ACPA4]
MRVGSLNVARHKITPLENENDTPLSITSGVTISNVRNPLARPSMSVTTSRDRTSAPESSPMAAAILGTNPAVIFSRAAARSGAS